MSRSFAVVTPECVRTVKQLACALRVARKAADAHPGFAVQIVESMPSRGTAQPVWPIATVTARIDPDTRGIVRSIDWTMA